MPGAVGEPLDLAGVAERLLGLDLGDRLEEVLAERLGPAAVGQGLLRRLGGVLGDRPGGGRHPARQPTASAATSPAATTMAVDQAIAAAIRPRSSP